MIAIKVSVWSAKRNTYRQYFMTVPKAFAEKFGEKFTAKAIALNKVLIIYVGELNEAIDELKKYIREYENR